MTRFLIVLGLASALAGCSHAPSGQEADPRYLLSHACSPGVKVKSAHGAILLKAHSPDASGQFPAQVVATAPDHLLIEVTNLLGGSEATIAVDGGRYRVTIPHGKSSEEGSDSWGGIPLEWATDLFLGRIPCPPSFSTESDLGVVNGELIAKVPASLGRDAEVFRYRFRNWAGSPWPEALHWERKGGLPAQVDFVFEDPEDKTRSPRRWEARSQRGEVKVRWRERSIQE